MHDGEVEVVKKPPRTEQQGFAGHVKSDKRKPGTKHGREDY
jgi:hypothetical protein